MSDGKEQIENPVELFSREFPLPSRGFLYEGKVPGGIVKLAPMTVKEEKILLSSGPNKLQALNAVIDRCLLTKFQALEDYAVADKFYMLLMIRVLSFPSHIDYEFDVECSSCRALYSHTVNLRDGLKSLVLNETDKEPFFVTLPICGKTLGLRYLRGRDEVAIERYGGKQKSGNDLAGDPSYIFRLASYIKTIDGQEVNAIHATRFVENLLSADSIMITQCVEEHTFGTELNVESRCPKCQSANDQVMPFTIDFFRPRSKIRKEGRL